MPHFVLLRHETPPGYGKPSHWDLMLEQDNRLVTWNIDLLPTSWAAALGEPVSSAAAPPIVATALADHRLAYLEYEGPLTGDRGAVCRCDGGTYELREKTPDRWRVRLAGQRLRGNVVLAWAAGDQWELAAEDELSCAN